MCILNIKRIWAFMFKYENNKTTQIFVQVISVIECEQNRLEHSTSLEGSDCSNISSKVYSQQYPPWCNRGSQV